MCRRKYRGVNNDCWWKENWEKGNYKIPRHFGIKNFIRSYLGIKTDLERFKNSDCW